MLVLSRRPGQKVVFPSLGISIEVLRSRGAVTRLGIEAAEDIPVLRDEMLAKQQSLGDDSSLSAQRHAWRNKLNQAILKLQILQRKLELRQEEQSEEHLADVLGELSDLEKLTTDTTTAPLAPLKILIVEDQDNERELLATCLRLGGIEVATTSNGQEAFDYLHDHELPNLVLLDMRMPDIDGPAFLKMVRDDIRLHNLRIFAVSGSSRSDFDTKSLQLDGWFSKPVRIDALMQAVRGQPTA